ncbi:KDO2-lipid IV(A) lauroyltransferase [Oceanospirillum multiglobuliferum]|uniref:Lipid A biosynthesis acyltransferase n=1 Tax=Oceanospirillum multiglobuliferum TaxID=64969 RepID=A0A1T4NSD9_9GAMM|nr:lysophospholipid acyltransferase family protein [Oceanospirillum multiglobuliferum]OPX55706.1 hypothetical protein BTE48_07375 [Oceanospirillum multiglobuliferum]SJZ81608.1 KDO2-lipid IV(A) lauroyltransferase [Oceanospirillum multiglobuliferum]
MSQQTKPMKQQLKNTFTLKLLAFCARQPLSRLYKMGSWLGRLLYRFGGRSVEVTKINVDLCYPLLNSKDKKQLITTSLQETLRTGFEFGWCWQADVKEVLGSIKTVYGLEHLEMAHQQGKGVIVLGPHLGNWELFGLFMSANYPMTAMYAVPKIAELDQIITKGRSRLDMQMVPANLKGVAQLLRKLQQGDVVGVLPDQEPDDRSGGVFAPFMGVEALSPKLVTRLIAKTGAQVVAGFAKRLPNGEGFEIHLIPADSFIYSADEREAVSAMNRMVEQLVAIAPEQYQWEYKRFKSRPNEGKDPYP